MSGVSGGKPVAYLLSAGDAVGSTASSIGGSIAGSAAGNAADSAAGSVVVQQSTGGTMDR